MTIHGEFEMDWTPSVDWMEMFGLDPDAPHLVTLTNTLDSTLDGVYVVTREDDGSYTLTPHDGDGAA